LLIVTITTKLISITDDGIRIGNAVSDTYSTWPRQEAKFVRWEEIKTLEIRKKSVRHGWVSFLKSFVVVKTADRKTYESFVAQPEHFSQAIKSLGKDKLLMGTKVTKERAKDADIGATTAERKWIAFTLIWVVSLLVVMLISRYNYGVLSQSQLTLLWCIVALPPLVYGILAKRATSAKTS
jgi:hypothetical protein